MQAQQYRFFCLAILLIATVARLGLAQQPKGNAKDMEVIAGNAEAFVEAFHKGDAKGLAGFWTVDGDFVDQTGRHVQGRAAIEKAFKTMFADNKGLKLLIESDSLRFVTPEVAIEEGVTSILSDKGPLSRAHYTIVHVSKDGKWFLGSVRNKPYIPATNYEHLRGLDWAIGEWMGARSSGEAEHLSFAWTENQNFIVGTFSTTANHVPVGGATIWTGWDPAAKKIRSWVFDSTGSFGEGTWSQEGKKWALKTTSVLPDGKAAAATYVLTRVDDDTLALQARERSEDGAAIPDGKEIKLKRVQ